MDVSRDSTAAQEMVRRTGQMGVPVTVLDGQAVIGFDQPRLKQLIAARASRAPGDRADRPAGPVGAAVKATPGGVLVGRVRPGSPAAASGLQVDDLIAAVDGHAVSEPVGFGAAFGAAATGSTLTVRRGGQEIELRVRR